MNIQDALDLFGLNFTVSGVNDTGIATEYNLIPMDKGATINRLKTRLDDLMSLTGEQISIVLNGGLWLRCEKQKKTVFNFSDYSGYVLNQYGKFELPYMIGLTSSECIIEDLAKAPHLLVAGTTGSGKSNYLHTLITCIAGNNNASLFLLDCKRVEFSVYEKIANVYKDIEGAYFITAWLLQEMDNRYKLMEKYGVNDIKELRKFMDIKYRVFVVDELCDLLSDKEAKKKIVPRLLRIAQLGRAAGIHLILATQRPDHTVINGTLKGNIPTRIAFNCASSFDSRVILDKTGAEYLTGNGDGLYLRNGSRDLIRFQACYYPMDEIKNNLKKGGF